MEPKVNILIVDDYSPNLIALGAVLSDPLYNLVEAQSGQEALEALEKYDIALVLLDIQMPGMDGYEVAKRIRTSPRTKTIPIIFITAVFREDPAVLRGYEVGGQDYLSKPFDPTILRAKVEIYSNIFRKNAVFEKKTQKLIESEEHYRLIVEGAQEIIATIDSHGIVTSLNYAFERLTGLKSNEWVGKSFLPLVHSADVPLVLSQLDESLRENTTELIRTQLLCADGRPLPIEISIQPFVKSGLTLGTVGVMRDISSRRYEAAVV